VIVEDNADSRDMLSELMRLKNFTVESCSTGAAAIELISTLKPNVGLIDIGLPDIDGYKIVQELNKHPERSSMVLVALTGYGQDEDRQRAQEAGFDYHLVKPVDFAKLNKIFDEIIKTKRAA
jgi:two-component system, chemotaxis family, CheB/CheR fusion protein